MNHGYAIIIPSRNEKNLQACLQAIKNNEPGGLKRVLVYDNDLSGGVRHVCEYFSVASASSGSTFVFSSAVNHCIQVCGDKDVIVMNDDAILQTPNGLTQLHNSGVGIVSSSVSGFIGNPEQKNIHNPHVWLRPLPRHSYLAFVCVSLSRELINEIGLFDERLIHYGWEDTLYCIRALNAGYELWVNDLCTVEHSTLPSTYRKPGAMPDLDLNRKIFEQIIQEERLPWPHGFQFPLEQQTVKPN
jgi:glycosyltransferase involved in cell wall biosynthesis